jgi:hypothetical protein
MSALAGASKQVNLWSRSPACYRRRPSALKDSSFLCTLVQYPIVVLFHSITPVSHRVCDDYAGEAPDVMMNAMIAWEVVDWSAAAASTS